MRIWRMVVLAKKTSKALSLVQKKEPRGAGLWCLTWALMTITTALISGEAQGLWSFVLPARGKTQLCRIQQGAS